MERCGQPPQCSAVHQLWQEETRQQLAAIGQLTSLSTIHNGAVLLGARTLLLGGRQHHQVVEGAIAQRQAVHYVRVCDY